MEIGQPRRVFTIEPVEDPVPQLAPEPAEQDEPEPLPEAPEHVPAYGIWGTAAR
jgi:hypothetical protein